MHALCQYVGGDCVQCGEPGRSVRTCPAGPNAHRLPKRPTPCAWLGQPVERVALVRCTGCGGNVRQKMPIHDCALFGDCVPRAVGVVESRGRKLQGCGGCERRATFQSAET